MKGIFACCAYNCDFVKLLFVTHICLPILTENGEGFSWTKGANIGWHSDDNRNYLKQRHYSV